MAVKDKFVRLTADQRANWSGLIAAGRHAAARVHARVLLKADPSAGGPG
ncbi:MAG: hypothetical protein J0I06_14850 [Planctomycetes bacterium]|nr:hypothetical protein [Planctomycetota bacterium]